MAFAGMNMANQAGGINAGSLFQMQADQAQAAPAASPAANSSSAASAASWTCSCGTVNTSKFCSQCGAPKPAPAAGWTCSCGAVNTGKFCSECGAKKPAGFRCTGISVESLRSSLHYVIIIPYLRLFANTDLYNL